MGIEEKIIKEVDEAKDKIIGNGKSKKRIKYYSGAVAVEIIRKYLKKEGFNVSPRDVFVVDYSKEIDLLILKKGAKSEYNLLFRPYDIIAAFEIKTNGLFSEEPTGSDELKIKGELTNFINSFEGIKNLNKNIICLYIAIKESPRWISAYDQHPDTAFCLSWTGKNPTYNYGCWKQIIEKIKTKSST